MPFSPVGLSTVSAVHKIICGVDFGTTSTGVSYVASNQTARDIEIIRNWPGPSRESDFVWKTPSRIAYGGESNASLGGHNVIGFQVKPNMDYYAWFKLKLDRTAATRYDDPSLKESEGPGVLRLPRGKSAREVCADYLKEVYRFTLQTLEQRHSPDLLRITPIEFWFTVPAIWSDSAKADTLTAARAAGFGERPHDNVFLIQEPEAAAIWTLKSVSPTGTEEQISPGDGVLICDCGGGTVDITTYVINKVSPELDFQELLKGDGGKCGSTYVDRNFLEWMSNTFGDAFRQLPFAKRGPGSNFMKEFERIKRDFGSSVLCDDTFEVTLVLDGVEDSDNYDSQTGTVMFDSHDLEGFFQPVVRKILDLLRDQLRLARAQTGRAINKIILVGGFGDSHYLLQTIRQWGHTEGVPRVICPDRPQAAVVLGATLRGFGGIKPKSRKCRRHYGFQLDLPFDPTLDEKDIMYKNKFKGTKMARGTMVWCLKMGQAIDENTLLRQKVSKPWVKGESREFVLPLYYCTMESPPRLSNHPRIHQHSTIKVDLSQTNFNKFKKKWLMTRDEHIWNIQYELQILFGSKEGILTVRAMDGSEQVGVTQIEYAMEYNA